MQSPICSASRADTSLGGIKGFRSWFSKHFPAAYTEIDTTNDSEEFDHVLIDMNQILHLALRRRVDEDKALFTMFSELDHTLRYANPRRCVVLAFDGPPPAAKLATQRSRRAKSVQSGGFETFEAVWGNVTAKGEGKGGVEPLKNLDEASFRQWKREQRLMREEHEKSKGDNGGEGKLYLEDQEIDYLEAQMNNGGRRYRIKRRLERCNESFTLGRLVNEEGDDSEELSLEGIVTKKWLDENRKRRTVMRKTEEAMVKITPGTEFMRKAAEACLYYVWQRLNQKRLRGIKFYISGADVPGEGEVKLLDWMQIPTLVRPGDSVAMIGGDSDLVLEGLALDPQITHNTFVILPEKRTKSYCVSLWETTRSLKSKFPNMESTADVLNMRTDLVVLSIFNGNDYFPKLRGANFERLFRCYKETVKKFYKEPHSCFLINPKTLEFNNHFCVEFFSALSGYQTNMRDEDGEGGYDDEDEDDEMDDGDIEDDIDEDENDDDDNEEDEDESIFNDSNVTEERSVHSLHSREMPLSVLHTLISQKIIPPPYFPKYLFSKKKHKAYLAVGGEVGLSDQVVFSLEYDNESLKAGIVNKKKLKQILAGLALDSLLPGWEDSPYTSNMRNVQSHVTSHDTVEYMKGILWNVEMYQKGACSDYTYNYGRRRAPSVFDMLRLFKKAEEDKKRIGMRTKEFKTRGRSVPPLQSPVSLLCSMPSSETHLIDKYFEPITKDRAIDNVYEECIDKESGWFNMTRFDFEIRQRLKHARERGEYEELDRNLGWPTSAVRNKAMNISNSQVQIGQDYWTVLTNKRMTPNKKQRSVPKKPLEPPTGFSKEMEELPPNPNIRAHSVKASAGASKHERRNVDKMVFGTKLTTAFDHLENNSENNSNSKAMEKGFGVDIEARPSLEHLPFKLAYTNRLKEENIKAGGGLEGVMYDKDGNKIQNDKYEFIEGFVNTQIEQAVAVGKLWYEDSTWTANINSGAGTGEQRQGKRGKKKKRAGGERRRIEKDREGETKRRKEKKTKEG